MTIPILVGGVCLMAVLFALIQLNTGGIKESWIVGLLLLTLSGVVFAENFMTGKAINFKLKSSVELLIAAFGAMVAITTITIVPVITGILVPASGIIALMLAVAAFTAMYT